MHVRYEVPYTPKLDQCPYRTASNLTLIVVQTGLDNGTRRIMAPNFLPSSVQR